MKKILLVENSSVIINFIQELFSASTQFKLSVAHSYKEANELIENTDFFLAISNLVLNDALNAEILTLFEKNKIPNIVLTSNMDQHTIATIQKYPVVDYILKSSMNELHKVYDLVHLLNSIQNRQVLVVEDSVTYSTLIKDSLKTLLLDVKQANNGDEALKILQDKSLNISLIITDYDMQKMNGLELAIAIQKNEKLAHIPVICMSSSLYDNTLKIQLYKHGIHDFIQKPILIEELKAKVITIYSKMKQLEDISSYNKVFDDYVISSKTDVSGMIIDVSQAFCDIAGYSKEEMIGRPHNLVRNPEMSSSVFREMWSTIQSGKPWIGEIKNLHKNGSSYWVKAIISPDFDSNGEIQGYTSIRQDITDKKHIYELSVTDGLTSLFNRRYFNDESQKIMSQSIRSKGLFGFIILDVDNFKKYNDTYGHQAGDEVLKGVATALQDTFRRDDDKVYRLGGEEFGITLCAKNLEDLQKRADLARNNIEALKIEHKNNPFKVVTASFGLTSISDDSNTINMDMLYKKADEALYQAKANGRNQVCYLEM